MIGETISHYRIIEKTGDGGIAVVFRAEAVIAPKKFVEIRKDADFDSPEMSDVKKKLKKLVSIIPDFKKEITYLKK